MEIMNELSVDYMQVVIKMIPSEQMEIMNDCLLNAMNASLASASSSPLSKISRTKETKEQPVANSMSLMTSQAIIQGS